MPPILGSSACLNAGVVRIWAPHSGFLVLLCSHIRRRAFNMAWSFLEGQIRAQNAVRRKLLETLETRVLKALAFYLSKKRKRKFRSRTARFKRAWFGPPI